MIPKHTFITCPDCKDVIAITAWQLNHGDIIKEGCFLFKHSQKLMPGEKTRCKKCDATWSFCGGQIHTEHGWQ